MRDLASLYQQQAAGLPEPQQCEIAVFTAKLDSFVHAPGTRVAAERLLPFSRQAAVVTLVAQVLPTYRPWARTYYDIIGYWYSVALLSLARTQAALRALHQLTTEGLAVGWADLDLLRRNYAFFPNVSALAPLSAAVAQHFQQLVPRIDALTWARQIGLQVPPEPNWQVAFELSTDGEKRFAFQLSPAEKAQRLELHTTVFGTPRGDGQSWEIRFRNADNSTGGDFLAPTDKYLRVQHQLQELPVAPSLLRFAETLGAIETAVGASFVRRISFSYFSKGIKNKAAVAQWLGS